MDTKKLKNIKRTNAWKSADWSYHEIITTYYYPFLGDRPTPEVLDSRMAEILKICPQYFPALLQRGQYYILRGQDDVAIKYYDQGIDIMIVLLKGEELIDTVHNVIDFLEQVLRYDICCKYLRLLTNLFPNNALYYDYLAVNIAESNKEDIKEALTIQAKALELEPTNVTFLSNQAWINLVAGKLSDAEMILKKAEKIKRNDEFIKGNIIILKYLKKTGGGTFLDYLLRPLNQKQIQQLEDNEDDEKLESLCVSYNEDRIEAFKNVALRNSKLTAHQMSELSKTLTIFFGFVDQIMYSVKYLYEDINEFHEYFKPIMHKFIFKHGDTDDGVFNDIYNALEIFYDFLSQQGLVNRDDYKKFIKDINKMKPELRKKMHQYNKIRHNDNISEEEKEDIREELFEGDHSWPHL